MSHPSWIAAANGLGTSTVASSFHSRGQRPRSLSLQPYSQDFHDLRLAGTPTRWHPDYSQTRNPYFQRSQSAGASISSALEPIPEDRAADHRQKRALAASPARTNNVKVKDTAQRRHSEGDLLGDPGRWRFVKRNSQQEYRRRSSQGDFQTTSYVAVSSALSGNAKRKLSVIAWPEDKSDVDERLDISSSLVQDARSDIRRQSSQAFDPDLAQRRASLQTMRQNSQTDASLENVEEVTSKSRRKSSGSRSVAGSEQSAPIRKASTISLTATAIESNQSLASRTTLAAVDIPLDFLQPPVRRLKTVLRPVLMCVLVMTLAASLSAALYFAVVLNRAQAREIAYLQATLRFHLEESEYQRLVAQTSSQKDEFAQQFCKEIDRYYQTSVLSSQYRGCRVSSIDHQEFIFLLYFDKPQNVTVTSQEVREDVIRHVLVSAADKDPQTGGVLILGSVRLQPSAIAVSLTVSSQGPESVGSGSSTNARTGQVQVFNSSAAATTSLSPVPAWDPLHPCLPGESDTRYRYPGSCSIFFQCLHGRAITMACGSTLVFDVTLNVCEVTTPDCNDTSATTQDSDAARPCEKNSGVYYPHPAACNLYIQCSNNITNVRICPDDLVFNPQTSTCIPLTRDFVCS